MEKWLLYLKEIGKTTKLCETVKKEIPKNERAE